MSEPQARAPNQPNESIKETLISIIISFALAFVARSYVAEPFVIPTGSMAPTLLGAHMRFHGQLTGHEWAGNPHDYARDNATPLPVQGRRAAGFDPIRVTDPMSLHQWGESDVPRRAGDRILVQKYLYAVRGPRRWEVVVFKNPEEPATNFIKRLVGMPGEELALIDGDVFTRPLNAQGVGEGEWRIQRKPARVQRAVWAAIFSSEYTPAPVPGGRAWRSPWQGEGWDTSGTAYTSPGAQERELAWDHAQRPITDDTAYNWTSPSPQAVFPVSDVRLRAGVEPGGDGLSVTARVRARGHVFEGVIGADGGATLRMRPDDDAQGGEWRVLGTGRAGALRAGGVTDVELWHVDQRLQLWVGGRLAASGEYDWTAQERLEHAVRLIDPARTDLANPNAYRSAGVSWSVSGAPVTLHRVGLDRDLHYQTGRSGGEYTRGALLAAPLRLGRDQFFMLGDNSPASRDGRSWDRVDPWVAWRRDDTPGVVPRSLIMGKAFFVYFPAPHPALRGVPVPDFGRLRLIR